MAHIFQDEHLLLCVSQVPCWDFSALLTHDWHHCFLMGAPARAPQGPKDPEACGREGWLVVRSQILLAGALGDPSLQLVLKPDA